VSSQATLCHVNVSHG